MPIALAGPACQPAEPVCAIAQVCGPSGERFGVGSDPARTLLRDVDGDGRLDFVAVSQRPGTLAVGWGWRGDYETWSIGQEPVDLAIGDVDGDGRLDVAAALAGEGAVALVRGAGPATLRPAERAAAGERPGAIVTADLDGDGRAEVVVADAQADALRVLRWDGARLSSGPAIAPGQGPVALAAGDVDGDGVDDVAVALRVDGVVKMFHGTGGELRAGGAWYAGPGPGRVAIADVDGDGARDVALVDGLADVAAVAFGDGAGAVRELRTWAVPAAPSDMVVRKGPNGHELVVRSGWQGAVTAIDPAGAQLTIPVSSPTLAAGDLDGDGTAEVVLRDGWTVLRDAPGVVFSPWWSMDAAGMTGPVATGDVDGDGALEVVVVDRLYGEFAAFSAGADGLVGPVRSPGPMFADALVLADVDGDGLAEAISWERAWFDVADDEIVPGRVRVDRGLGGGQFAPWAEFDAEGDVRRVLAWDVEGDGRAELVMFHERTEAGIPFGSGNFASSRISVLELDDAGLREREKLEGGLFLGGIVGEFDEDPEADLLLLSTVDGMAANVSLLERGEEGLAPHAIGSMPGLYGVSALTVGDLTGDGLRDLVMCGRSEMALARGLADGTFAEPERIGDGHECLDVQVGDGDGDGEPEVVASVLETTMVAVAVDRLHALPWLRQLVPAGVTTTSNRPRALALADLDGDGAIDVVASGEDGLQALRGGPGQVLQVGDGEEIGAGAGRSTQLHDLDGDGLDEVIVLGQGGDVGVALPDRAGSWGPVRHARLWTEAEGEGAVRLVAAVAADVDGDGRHEVLASLSRREPDAPAETTRTVLYAPLDGSVQVLETGDTFNRVSGLASGDIDGDGDDDIVGVFGGLDVLAVRLGDPQGLGPWQVSGPAGSQSSAVELSDVDGDGHLDALVRGYASNVYVHHGDGRGGFSATSQVWPFDGKRLNGLAVADVDGDGYADMTAWDGSTTLYVCPGGASGRGGRCRQLRPFPDGHGVRALAIEDVDGDGVVDLLAVTEDGGEPWLVFGRGGGGRFAVHRKPLPDVGALGAGALTRARVDDSGSQWVYVDVHGVTPVGVPAR